ncbi:cation diffusion facilitator family transporter [Actinoallomurus liliacearum]|uniref:Cation diffusion facilitator family transporter n=1 Tax=Actinoallomurus liliacearum TaxID=1080073 RepID=A0ABP8TE88_9ACTN
MNRSTRRTVLVAGAANLVVAATKLAAGLISGSSAMLAEAAHSLADTLNQAFLLTSLRKSNRPPDRDHPFGYGQERYFWSLLAAFGIFVAGAGFSVFEGILAMLRPHGHEDPLIAYIVLAVSFVAEGISFARAVHQMRQEAEHQGREVLDHVRRSPDMTVKAALFEDTAAVIGLVLAGGGLLLTQLTGSSVWDGAASVAVGVLLIVVAYRLGRDSRDMLIGHAADPDEQRLIAEEINATEGVDDVAELLTMRLGPDHLLIAARASFVDDITAEEVEDMAEDIDRRVGERLSVTPHVFIDPTRQRTAAQRPGFGSGERVYGHSCSDDDGQAARAEDPGTTTGRPA